MKWRTNGLVIKSPVVAWNDIWLNEGFATYVASLVIENFDGQKCFYCRKKQYDQQHYLQNQWSCIFDRC